MKTCTNCGVQQHPKAMICSNCDARLPIESSLQKDPQITVDSPTKILIQKKKNKRLQIIIVASLLIFCLLVIMGYKIMNQQKDKDEYISPTEILPEKVIETFEEKTESETIIDTSIVPDSLNIQMFVEELE